MIATIADIITDTITADTNIINTAANEGAVYHPPPPHPGVPLDVMPGEHALAAPLPLVLALPIYIGYKHIR